MSKFITVFLALAIFLLNVWLVFPLFQGEYTQFVQSIEVSYITMAKFITKFWSGAFGGWNPTWYLGYPLYLLYTPLLPVLEVLLHRVISAISFARAYRLITASAYCLVPVSLYVFTLRISKRRLTAFVAAVAFSVLPSINYLIEEVRNVAAGFSLAPWRLVILTLYGEGPHTFSQVFLLLAAAAYHKLLDVRTFTWSVITALLVALTGLTNAVGFSALAILFIVIAFCEIVLDKNVSTRVVKFKVSLTAAVLSYGLLAFWYNFSFISNFFGEGGGILKNYLGFFPWGFVLLGLIIGVVSMMLSWLRSGVLRIVSLWLLVFFMVVVAHYAWDIDFVPQALRLMTEVDMAFAVILGILVGGIGSLGGRPAVRRVFSGAVLAMALLVVVYISRDFLGFTSEEGRFTLNLTNLSKKPYSHLMTRPGNSLGETAEFEISQWLSEEAGSDRVYLSGNYAFWLNFFTDVPQVRGALDQAVVHPWVMHANYQIYHGVSGEISIAWAKIMNVKYMVVNTLTSPNPFKDYLFPDKFEGLLEPVYEEHGDIIYKVPLEDDSLAKAVDLLKQADLSSPVNAIDEVPILEYVDWLEQGKSVSFKKVNNNHYQIEGELSEDEGILIQMAYHSGWRATSFASDVVGRRRLKVRSDVMGFMLIDPIESGMVTIDLKYGGIFWQYVGYGVTAATIFYVLYRGFLELKVKFSWKIVGGGVEKDLS